MKNFRLINHPPLPDGTIVSDVLDGDDDADADILQGGCSDSASSLQTSCSDAADTLQPFCGDFAASPQQPKRTPRKPLNPALVDFLANDAHFQKSVYGWFGNVEELVENQKNAPEYQCKYLVALGFNTNVEELTRTYIPQARVERQKRILGKQIKTWQKVAAALAVVVLLLWITRPSGHDRVEELMPVPSGRDSAITWAELQKMLKVYNDNSDIKIWYAPPLYREINDKNITDVSEIKRIFDQRAEEIKRVQNN